MNSAIQHSRAMAQEAVSHKGVVTGVSESIISVEIISESACAACHAKGLCSLSEYTSKAIQVPARPWEHYELGQEVDVLLKASMGHKAVWIAYVIPLIVLMTLIFVPLSMGSSELLAAACGFAGIALYYMGVYALKDKLNKYYNFTLQPHKTDE